MADLPTNLQDLQDNATGIAAAVESIATAITTKGGTLPNNPGLTDFPGGINSIPTSVPPVLITKTITGNGVYKAEDEEADGYSTVTVDVGDEDYTINVGLIRSRMYNTGFAIVGSIVEEV